MATDPTTDHTSSPRTTRYRTALLLLIAGAAAVLITLWGVKNYLLVSDFTPVTLNPAEARQLERKLSALETLDTNQSDDRTTSLEPEPYSEAGARRSIQLNEKEINALLAKNTDLAHKLAIDLADDLLSITLLLPMDETFPILGGQTLRLRAGAELAYRDGRPVVVLKGVTIMGIPLPNAWLGGLKNIDLVEEFGGNEGFWQRFADGIDQILVEEGRLAITLKE